jgi:hypothetical protein
MLMCFANKHHKQNIFAKKFLKLMSSVRPVKWWSGRGGVWWSGGVVEWSGVEWRGGGWVREKRIRCVEWGSCNIKVINELLSKEIFLTICCLFYW